MALSPATVLQSPQHSYATWHASLTLAYSRSSLPLSSAAASSSSSSLSFSSSPLSLSFSVAGGFRSRPKSKGLKVNCSNAAHRLLKVMISGAPASGKGTQCEMIVEKDRSKKKSSFKNFQKHSNTERGDFHKVVLRSGHLHLCNRLFYWIM